MIGVSFDGKHSYNDLGLITNKIIIGYPAVKTNYVDVPGRDGSLDLTESLGELRYEDRKLEFQFTLRGTDEEQKGKIAWYLTGGKRKIILDKDREYYYLGRCSVNSFDNRKNISELSLTALCEPYKYRIRETVHREMVRGSRVITLRNDKKSAVPVIECESKIKVGYEGIFFELPEGKHKVLDIRLKEGYNRITVAGNGMVLFRYQEGAI